MRPRGSSRARPVPVDNHARTGCPTPDHKSLSATGGSSRALRGVVAERYGGSSRERPYPLVDPLVETLSSSRHPQRNAEAGGKEQMMSALKLCTYPTGAGTCGEPCTDGRCAAHRPVKDQTKRPTRAQTGYTSAWDRLSAQARRLQPWCTDCGTKNDLTADHLRWPALRIEHVDVVCRSCNSARGETPRDGKLHRGRGANEALTGPRGMASSPTQSDTEYAFPWVDRG
jgi:hypothetical protein